jgi:hypothetical protein
MGLVDLSYGPFGQLSYGPFGHRSWSEPPRKESPRGVGIVVAAIIRGALGAGPARRLERPRNTLCGVWLNQQPLSSSSTA